MADLLELGPDAQTFESKMQALQSQLQPEGAPRAAVAGQTDDAAPLR